ncbi:mannose-1-phosphate guanyltransferase beta [Sarcoptes scabiei]|nr:mannose-1-phosphate guanyltransferase beta [Sarcoptes scabiei]
MMEKDEFDEKISLLLSESKSNTNTSITSDNEIEDKTNTFKNLFDEALYRLSNESDSNDRVLKNRISSNSYPNDGIDHYQNNVVDGDGDNDLEDYDDDDDDEEKRLLKPLYSSPSTRTTIPLSKVWRNDRYQLVNGNVYGNVKKKTTECFISNILQNHRYTNDDDRNHNQNDNIAVSTTTTTTATSTIITNRVHKSDEPASGTGIINEAYHQSTTASNMGLQTVNVIDNEKMKQRRSQQNLHPSSSSSSNSLEVSNKINWYIYLVTSLSAIGGFLFGYDTGIVSGSMVFIRDYFHLSTTMQEIVISVTILTAWLSSFVAGYLTNKFGRKLVILIASFVFTIGGLMMAFAHTEYVLLAGRAIIGFAIGLASMAIPVYIAEAAPVHIRGKLVSTNVCFITFGQFVASIVAGLFSNDHINGWRWMLGLSAVPSILQLIFFTFLPESPRWLVQKGRYDLAYQALTKFRYANTVEEDIRTEFASIKESCLNSERDRNNSKSIKAIVSNPMVMRALFVGCLLMIIQQVAGINTVMYYSATIIQMSGVTDKSTAVWLSALTASINFIFSFVGLVLVERLGRRRLTLSSLFGVIISLLILAAGFQLAEINSPPVSFNPNPNDDSICSRMRNCDQCVSSLICGYCFSENTKSGNKDLFVSLLQTNKFNGTCLPKNPATQLPFANSSFCVNGTRHSMMWTESWCPSQYSWMTLAGLMLYLFFFAPGMGPMPWTINSEIYPLWTRSFCYSMSTSFNWFFNLLVSLTFLTLTNLLTIYGAFYLYTFFALIGLILFYFFLPETKDKSLEEIEFLFEQPLCQLHKKRQNLSRFHNVDSTVNVSNENVNPSITTSSTNDS